MFEFFLLPISHNMQNIHRAEMPRGITLKQCRKKSEKTSEYFLFRTAKVSPFHTAYTDTCENVLLVCMLHLGI